MCLFLSRTEKGKNDVVNLILEKLDNTPAPSIFVQLFALGGKMNRVGA